MCSSQTIRSPGCGLTSLPVFGIALPAFCAHAYTSSTRPKPWPLSPNGTPASRAAQEVKYAHHGPTPEPAVAWRNWAMRGESLEPGGCSATPTSPRTALSTAWPAVVGAAAVVAAAEVPVRVAGPPAFCRALANAVGTDGVGAAVAGAAPGANIDCSWAIRASATSKLTALFVGLEDRHL